jgi:hypothetical protein
MRLHVPLAVAAAAALAGFAPSASAADPICVDTAGDGKNPLRSTACVVVTQEAGSTTITTGCSLLAGRAECAIKPVTVPTP